MHQVQHVANVIIAKEEMRIERLQALLYLIYAEYLVKSGGTPCFLERPIMTNIGPAFRSIHVQWMQFQENPVMTPFCGSDKTSEKSIGSDHLLMEVIDHILRENECLTTSRVAAKLASVRSLEMLKSVPGRHVYQIGEMVEDKDILFTGRLH